MTFIRLNKYLGELGIASRRAADRLIEEGAVTVNGKVVNTLGSKVDPAKDLVKVKNKISQPREGFIYIALNKPTGYVTACRRTSLTPDIVLDLVDIPERIFPVGRLDKDTTGLLLLTNDGDLTFHLTHPSGECEKEYEALLSDAIPASALAKLEQGVMLSGEKTQPVHVALLQPNRIRLILKEGRNRQVRRICQKVGYPVCELKRIRIKKLMLGDLPLGQWRPLTSAEVEMLKN